MPPFNLDVTAWTRLSALLDRALEVEPPLRDRWLAELPAEDAAYRPLLEELLRGGPSATSEFLRSPPVLAGADIAARVGGDALASGRTVGPYRLLRELGSGGMGAVWLAERSDGQLRRQVALKLPIASWAPGLAQRMARERDIQATLEHPNIARLYDAGVDVDGRPYLALEYVDGSPIDRYAAEHALPVADRVRLFIQVARAVAYAHSRLIVHRDIKPSNVLVTRDGRAHLLDFGIAKLLAAEAGSEGAVTELAGRALTPDYAAPEQIRGEVVTAATDVYSLGVLLYELLTGQRPYRLERSSRGAIEQAILTAEPPAPSSRAVAADRALLRGDLDAILNKALKKAPDDRYASVEALVDDLERHLAGLPVRARPDSPLYRARKFVRRNALPVGAAAAVFVALAGGLAATAWQAREAGRQRDFAVQQQRRAEAAFAEARAAQQREARQAELARNEAQRASAREVEAREQRELAMAASAQAQRAAAQARAEASRARATQQFLVDVFRANSADQDDPEQARRTTARELLDRGAARIEVALADQPDARREMTQTLAKMYADLGLAERSSELARVALGLTERRFGPDSLETADAALDYAIALEQGARDTGERLRLIERARAITRRHRNVPPLLRWRIEYAAAGALETRDRALARDHAARAIEFAAQVDDPQALQYSLLRAGSLASMDGDPVAAEPLLARALELGESRQTFGASDRTRTRVSLANAQGSLLKLEAAEASLRRALADSERSNGADHIDTRQTMLRLGVFLIASADRPREAVDWLTRVADSSTRSDQADPFTAAPALLELGRALLAVGESERAELEIRRALQIREDFRPGTLFTAQIREALALALMRQGRVEEASAQLDQSEDLRRRLGEQPGSPGWEAATEYRFLLALNRENYGEAARLLDTVRQGRLDRAEPTRSWMNGALRRARVAVEAGDVATARAYLATVDAVLEQRGIRAQLAILEGQRLGLCGRIALQAGDPAAARRLYQRALELIVQRTSISGPAAADLQRWIEALPATLEQASAASSADPGGCA